MAKKNIAIKIDFDSTEPSYVLFCNKATNKWSYKKMTVGEYNRMRSMDLPIPENEYLVNQATTEEDAVAICNDMNKYVTQPRALSHE